MIGEDFVLEEEFVVVVQFFVDCIDVVCVFIVVFVCEGEECGFIGLLEFLCLWICYILNSVIVVLFFYGFVVDIGFGVGFLGIVFVIVCLDVIWMFVELMECCIIWFIEWVQVFGLENVIVFCVCVEDVWLVGGFDVVIVCVVSVLWILILIIVLFVCDGGELIFFKGMNVVNEIEVVQKQIKKFWLSDVCVEVLGEGVFLEIICVVWVWVWQLFCCLCGVFYVKYFVFVFGVVVMMCVFVDVLCEMVVFGQDVFCGCDWLMCGW